MDKRAWVGQLKKQVDAKGTDAAPWYVFWHDPDTCRQKCKSCGPGKVGKSSANRLADTIHSQLVTGTYQSLTNHSWEAFRDQYKSKIVARLAVRSRDAIQDTIAAIERVIGPKWVKSITTDAVDAFITKRLAEDGIRERKISPATVNKDLRNLRAMMNVAKEWGMVKAVPRMRFLKVSTKLPTYVSPEHFAAIYGACETAKAPAGIPNVSPADWWRALLTMASLTGWRVGQLLALQWSDIDLNTGEAITRAEAVGNKGKRDERIPLHPIVVEHLRRLAGSFDARVFPWNQHYRKLWPHFAAIQANTKIPGDKPNETKPLPQCGKNGWYGFHDIRRAFATFNAAQMDLFQLQALMQHKSLETTKSYVNMSNRLTDQVKALYVPPILQRAEIG